MGIFMGILMMGILMMGFWWWDFEILNRIFYGDKNIFLELGLDGILLGFEWEIHGDFTGLFNGFF